jgi:hypothetical protein
MVELGIAGGYAARHGGATLMGNVWCFVVCCMSGQRRFYIAGRKISRRVMALIIDVEIRAISMGNQQSGHVCGWVYIHYYCSHLYIIIRAKILVLT